MKGFVLSLILLVSLNGFGQEIIDFSMSDCERGSYPQFTKNRLISKESKSDTTFLKVGMVLNCGIEPVPLIEQAGDSLFISFKDTSEGHTMCDCCFELNYTLIGIPDTNFLLFYGKKGALIEKNDVNGNRFYRELVRHTNKFTFPSYEELMEAVECKNPNQASENGEKIGVWIQSESQEDDSPFTVSYYELDENGKAFFQWRARFSVEQYLDLTEISIRTSRYNVSAIEGYLYYQMFGIERITD